MIISNEVKALFPEDAVFFNPSFLNTFEDHIPYILRKGEFETRTLSDAAMALRFKGDFNGLMLEMGIANYLRYPNMRLSGLYKSTDYNGEQLTLTLVKPAYFVQLSRTWVTQNR